MPKILRSRGDMVLRAILKKQRETAGLDQEAVSRRLGQPLNYCWKVENGERALKFIEAQAHAKVIGISFHELAARYEALLEAHAMPGKKKSTRKPDET